MRQLILIFFTVISTNLLAINFDFNIVWCEANNKSHLINSHSDEYQRLHDKFTTVGAVTLSDYNAVDKNGMTPLMYAAINNHQDFFKYLIAVGANINARDREGYPVIWYALLSSNLTSIKTIIQHGAIIDEPNEYGNSPLMLAASKGNFEICKELISAGAKVDRINNEGFSIIDIAKTFKVDRYKDIILLVSETHPNLRLRSKEFRYRKRLAHALDIDGTSLLSTIGNSRSEHIKLTWGNPSLWFSGFNKNFPHFAKIFPENFKENDLIQNTISFTAHDSAIPVEDKFRRIKSNLPTILFGGTSTHVITCLIRGDTFMLINLGKHTRRPVEIYQFDPESFTIDILKSILETQRRGDCNYINFFHEVLPLKLHFISRPIDDYIENSLNLKNQTVGNCSWKNSTISFYMLLILERLIDENILNNGEQINEVRIKQIIKEQEQVFYQWLFYEVSFTLRKLVASANENHFVPDLVLIKAALEYLKHHDFLKIVEAIKNLGNLLSRKESCPLLFKTFNEYFPGIINQSLLDIYISNNDIEKAKYLISNSTQIFNNTFKLAVEKGCDADIVLDVLNKIAYVGEDDIQLAMRKKADVSVIESLLALFEKLNASTLATALTNKMPSYIIKIILEKCVDFTDDDIVNNINLFSRNGNMMLKIINQSRRISAKTFDTILNNFGDTSLLEALFAKKLVPTSDIFLNESMYLNEDAFALIVRKYPKIRYKEIRKAISANCESDVLEKLVNKSEQLEPKILLIDYLYKYPEKIVLNIISKTNIILDDVLSIAADRTKSNAILKAIVKKCGRYDFNTFRSVISVKYPPDVALIYREKLPKVP